MANHTPDIILTDFKKIQTTPYVPQDRCLEIFPLVMAKAICLEENITLEKEVNRKFEEIREKIKKYGIASEHIAQRQIVAATMNLENIPKTLMVGNQFVDLKIISATHKNFLKEHREPRGIFISERMDIFDKICQFILSKIYDSSSEIPDDIIHVTCSGYSSPSPAEVWVSRNKWFNTTVTHSYHMGCYGFFPAVRMAHGFLASSFLGTSRPKKRADIFHTEVPSLHMDIRDSSAENIVFSTLFGDGFVKYSAILTNPDTSGTNGFKVLSIKENLLPDSLNDMTWRLGEHHFRMSLSIKVPLVIKKYIKEFVNSLMRQAGKRFEDEKDRITFAIHPGGPKIIDFIRDELKLEDSALSISRKVFRENGNISSATLPSILTEMDKSGTITSKSLVLCLAFGPGLTAAGMLLERTG